MNTASPFERLSWDSALFGYGVVRIHFQTRPDIKDISTIRESFRNTGCRLAYLDWLGNNPFPEPQTVGLSYCGTKVEFGQDILRSETALDSGITLASKETDAIRDLAAESGRHSRFFRDPEFRNGEYRLLYNRWIGNAFSPSSRSSCFVIGPATEPAGLITIEEEVAETGMRIGLLAVHPRARRSGVGTRLVAFACAFAALKGASRLSVATQGDNTPAMALYRKSGFRPVSATTIAHLWIDS